MSSLKLFWRQNHSLTGLPDLTLPEASVLQFIVKMKLHV